MSDRNLKDENLPWLRAFVGADLAVFIAIIQWDKFLSLDLALAIATGWAAGGAVLGIALVRMANELLERGQKQTLIWWSRTENLPSRWAFSKLVAKDYRLEEECLPVALGVATLPTDPTEQDALWYRTYRRFENHPRVLEAHQSSLLARDVLGLMYLTLIFKVAVVGLLWATGQEFEAAALPGITVLLMVFVTISARRAGERFVCSVLVRAQDEWNLRMPDENPNNGGGVQVPAQETCAWCGRTISELQVACSDADDGALRRHSISGPEDCQEYIKVQRPDLFPDE